MGRIAWKGFSMELKFELIHLFICLFDLFKIIIIIIIILFRNIVKQLG